MTNADEDALEERIAKLERLKAEAVAKEDYELAASLKKQIERLKAGGQPVEPVEPGDAHHHHHACGARSTWHTARSSLQ